MIWNIYASLRKIHKLIQFHIIIFQIYQKNRDEKIDSMKYETSSNYDRFVDFVRSYDTTAAINERKRNGRIYAFTRGIWMGVAVGEQKRP